MAISLSSISKTTSISAPRVLIYGPAGVGKTTWAAGAPAPVFIFTEDGSGILEVDAFPVAQTYEDVLGAIGVLYAEEHAFQTLVIDSIDHLEPLVWDRVCRTHGIDSIEALGYGKGYVEALMLWRQILDGLNALRETRGMAIILIGHAQVKRFESPEHDSIDRYEPKLHAKASALVQESVDCILFAKHKTATKTEDLGFKKTRTRGISTGVRVLETVETASAIAKNRYNLPHELPLAWQAFADAMSASKQPTNQAA